MQQLYTTKHSNLKRVVTSFRDLLRYFDFAYLLRFVLILIGLKCFNYCYRGLTDDTGIVHSAFLGNYLNYVSALKWLLLQGAHLATGALDVETTVVGLRKLQIPGRSALILGMPCVGLGMIFFWIAFVAAHQMAFKQKLLWCIGGIISICLINCLRISMMVVALQYRWNFNRYMNHHDLFKFCAYLLILLMMRAFYKQYKKSATIPVPFAPNALKLL